MHTILSIITSVIEKLKHIHDNMSVMKSGLYNLEHETPQKFNLFYNFKTFKPGFCLGLKQSQFKIYNTVRNKSNICFV